LETQARTSAAGSVLAGPDAYQRFLYLHIKEKLLILLLQLLDREQQKGIASLRQRAAQAGAFGGGREAAMLGEYQAAGDIQRALAEAQIRQQGFQQAQTNCNTRIYKHNKD
jgi:hypothetical protein